MTERTRVPKVNRALVPSADSSRTTAELVSDKLTIGTFEELLEYLKLIQVGHGFPITMVTTLERYDGNWDMPAAVMRATMRVRDRDAGTTTDVTAFEYIFLPTSPKGLWQRHTALLKKLLEHELLEHYYVAGRRLLDPHDER